MKQKDLRDQLTSSSSTDPIVPGPHTTWRRPESVLKFDRRGLLRDHHIETTI